MLEQIDAVIFDMDGTLIDSMWVWTSIDADYIRRYHLTPPENFHKQMEGMSYTETAEYFLRCFPQLPHTVEELKKDWYESAVDKYTHEVQMKDGVREFILELRRRRLRIGIATSNDRRLVEDTLAALQIAECFDTITTSCEVKKGKPAPDVYLDVAAKLQTPPERCLVFEDVPMGILAGKNAGMKVCAVDDSFSRTQDETKRDLADYYIHNYHEILTHTFEVL